jgi:phosphatidylserine/phosphatidylglycerophosphate/cardiolipin synthase-like enzyme
MLRDPAIERWFLTSGERGNAATTIDRARPDGSAWTQGNDVGILVHGGPYFEALLACLEETSPGDEVSFLDWRGDPDERLTEGRVLVEELRTLIQRGVTIRGLVWRSHSRWTGFHLERHVELARELNPLGGQVVLDQRVRRAGSHHQKLVLIRHRHGASRDIAFVGGIDLCHGRRDDGRHVGDPQPEEMDERYGERPPWHDIQICVRGPAVADLDHTFRERWNDPTPAEDRRTPVRTLLSRVADQPTDPHPMLDALEEPPAAGSAAVQVLRTYPSKRPPFPFAPEGERSVVRAYRKVFRQARSLIYVEDQYLWSRGVADLFAETMERSSTLKLIVVVPQVPDQNGRFSGPPQRLAQLDLIRRLEGFGPERFAIFDLENEAGVPIYVHAKTVIVDDTWAAVGSDNLNRRSWTHDSEVSCAILDAERDRRNPVDPGGHGDGARVFARNLRLTLLREHLCTDDEGDLLDPHAAFDRVRSSADALDTWHRDGGTGSRPPGRLRNHRPPAARWWERGWSRPIYGAFFDPDGRPRSMRRAGLF